MKYSDLHNYQLRAVEHILSHKQAALFLEMGLGKTVSTLTAINHLIYEELEIDQVLVIAPKRVAESVWDAEIANWDHLHNLSLSKVIGSEKQRIRAIEEKADIYVIGRDNVAWLEKYLSCSKSPFPFQMLVIDELSSFKNCQSQRFKRLRKMRPFFSRIVGLTGTPSPNGLMDLWAQLFILDGGDRLFPTISRYREVFFKPDKINGFTVYSYKALPGADKTIFARIEDICMSMKAEDYLELPPLMHNEVKIRMTDEVKRQYREFKREQLLDFDGVEVTAINAAVLSNKLLQFANGAVYDSEGKVHHIHDLKLSAVKELVEQAEGESVLIAWTFRSDRDRMLEVLKEYEPRCLEGAKDISDWNEGKIKVLLMHPASGGHGLNLQAGGHTIIWFGQTWNLELYQQLNARLYRQGQKKPVIIHHLVLQGTIDESVICARGIKAVNQESLMEAIKERMIRYTHEVIKGIAD